MFDRANPARLRARQVEPLLQPEFEFELAGQYEAGTTFAEGIVFFKDTFFLYFGAADSFVGVATLEASRTTPIKLIELEKGV